MLGFWVDLFIFYLLDCIDWKWKKRDWVFVCGELCDVIFLFRYNRSQSIHGITLDSIQPMLYNSCWHYWLQNLQKITLANTGILLSLHTYPKLTYYDADEKLWHVLLNFEDKLWRCLPKFSRVNIDLNMTWGNHKYLLT